MSNYFLNINGANVGPLTEEEIRMKVKTGEANPSTLMWKEGMPQWVPLGSSPFMAAPPLQAVPSPQPFQQQGQLQKIHATFGSRFLAICLDGLIMLIPNIVVAAIGGRHTLLLQLGISIAYYIHLQQKMEGTLGKHIVGIRVVNVDYSQITPQQAGMRYLFYILSSLPLGAGLIAAAFDEHGRGWHDKGAKTVVVTKQALDAIRAQQSQQMANQSYKQAA